MGRVLETYVVNTLNAEYYYRWNGREINVTLKSNGEMRPIEVKEKADAKNIGKLKRNMKYISAEGYGNIKS